MEVENEVKENDEPEEEAETEEHEKEAEAGGDYHRFEEQVNLLLESAEPTKMRNMSRKYVRVSSMATITHLKKFLALKVLDNSDPEAFRNIDITCDGERIPQVNTLNFRPGSVTEGCNHFRIILSSSSTSRGGGRRTLR